MTNPYTMQIKRAEEVAPTATGATEANPYSGFIDYARSNIGPRLVSGAFGKLKGLEKLKFLIGALLNKFGLNTKLGEFAKQQQAAMQTQGMQTMEGLQNFFSSEKFPKALAEFSNRTGKVFSSTDEAMKYFLEDGNYQDLLNIAERGAGLDLPETPGFMGNFLWNRSGQANTPVSVPSNFEIAPNSARTYFSNLDKANQGQAVVGAIPDKVKNFFGSFGFGRGQSEPAQATAQPQSQSTTPQVTSVETKPLKGDEKHLASTAVPQQSLYREPIQTPITTPLTQENISPSQGILQNPFGQSLSSLKAIT